MAILDFEVKELTQAMCNLTERMRTEIGNTNAVRLIERKAVEKIMEEQGFQQTGCTSDECAAEVGQLLVCSLWLVVPLDVWVKSIP